MSEHGPTSVALEIHCRLATRTKLFSSLPTYAGTTADPGDPRALATPGTLPVPNRRAVELALRLALRLQAVVAASSGWVRRHGFDPRAPRGYRICQSAAPLARGGSFVSAGRRWAVEVVRLAEDLGEPHAPHRAGDPRVEIVVVPIDLAGELRASAGLRALRSIVTGSGVVDAGTDAIRCLAHVMRHDADQRCTLVDVDSPALIDRAIAQTSAWSVLPPTLRYDAAADRLRPHEATHAHEEYELPDPDLPPLLVDAGWLARIRRE